MKKGFVFLLLALLVVSVVLNVIWWPRGRDVVVSREVATVIEKVPSKDTMPKVIREQPLEVVVVATRQKSDADPLRVEVRDSDTLVSVPITQRVYEDSNYVAYVSGYRAKLDSIMVTNTFRTQTIREVVRSEKPPNRWSFGIVGGYGIGVLDKKVQPFVGVGIAYRLF